MTVDKPMPVGGGAFQWAVSNRAAGMRLMAQRVRQPAIAASPAAEPAWSVPTGSTFWL